VFRIGLGAGLEHTWWYQWRSIRGPDPAMRPRPVPGCCQRVVNDHIPNAAIDRRHAASPDVPDPGGLGDRAGALIRRSALLWRGRGVGQDRRGRDRAGDRSFRQGRHHPARRVGPAPVDRHAWFRPFHGKSDSIVSTKLVMLVIWRVFRFIAFRFAQRSFLVLLSLLFFATRACRPLSFGAISTVVWLECHWLLICAGLISCLVIPYRASSRFCLS